MYTARITYRNTDLGELEGVSHFKAAQGVFYFEQNCGSAHVIPMDMIASVNLEKIK